ncbi:hypothetical protein T492DRAFT_858351 [Pavlovales sp. CCMP2436]|nr:hypothetical protein T492DRAFT_858351 [Pavlovales sp. CCMP2436]
MIDHHRNIFTLKIGPQPITFCCHPEGYETFGRGRDDVLDQAAVYSFTIPAFETAPQAVEGAA